MNDNRTDGPENRIDGLSPDEPATGESTTDPHEEPGHAETAASPDAVHDEMTETMRTEPLTAHPTATLETPPTQPLAGGHEPPPPGVGDEAWIAAAPAPGEPAPGSADQPATRAEAPSAASAGTPSAPVWSAATVAEETPVPPRRTRTGTLVLGIVLALIGVGAIVTGLGYQLDLQLALAALLVVAAVVLLVTPLVQRGRSSESP
ncbi:hypothetical protein GCM10023169_06050 [Georgenia halophila]|uniref:Uncharacterized protein n=1 Tax=Georgenia halophila TaxID=620889 RepID=A0ABP8KVE8_9MICO